ncbi:MAG: recombinase family protein [Thermoleophilia bacterium]
MQPCVIYARVSTKEQQEEGYSIPAQLKAVRSFCEKEGLETRAEFVEAASAGRAGRREFGRMLDYLREHAEVRVVVAHKLDRLYRNFSDQVRLEEEVGARARYVLGDVTATPQGELLRDIQLSTSKFYLGNLREEVKKGMDEKVAQGGLPGRAPVGYRNDRLTRSVVVDPVPARHVAWAFSRYASGTFSLSKLADHLHGRGFRSIYGGKVGVSALHKILRNPFYRGDLRYRGRTYRGNHEALVTRELFQAVQERLSPNKVKNQAKRHVYGLRGPLVCAECGCQITAERQRGHVYYHCTFGKGRDACGQHKYVREEPLAAQVESILAEIEIGPDLVEALLEESRLLDEAGATGSERERHDLEGLLAENDRRAGRLLEAYLDAVLDAETYRQKAADLAERAARRKNGAKCSDRWFRTWNSATGLSRISS